MLRGEPGRASANRLLILTPETAGLMPGGACLRVEDFSRVRGEIASREAAAAAVVLSGWNGPEMTVESVDLGVRPALFSRETALAYDDALKGLRAADATRSVMSPEEMRRGAPGLARQAVDGRVRAQTLRTMVGAGPGTTPSGDDVIVGVLAGLRALGLDRQAAALALQLGPLIGNTTLASRHYLSAAIEGRFGEHVHRLVAALAHGEPTERTLENAALWGATSGTDLLFGLVATLVTSLNNGSIESAA